MTTLKRIYYLLQPEERRKVWKMAGTVFFSALLDFVSLAALLPVLYILLKGGENRRGSLAVLSFSYRDHCCQERADNRCHPLSG